MSEKPRIVSLVPSFTEILYFLGLERQIVGVTEHCDFPAGAKTKDKVGSFGWPLTDKILALKPDLVLADAAMHREDAAQLRKTGIEVIAFTPVTVDDIFRVMDEIAKFCFIETAVKPLVYSLRERVYQLAQKSCYGKPRVFRIMTTKPLITPGPGSFQYDALQKAGALLMDFQAKDPYVEVLPEQVAKFDPEVILFCGVEKGQKLPLKCNGCAAERPICRMTADDVIRKEWAQVKACRKNRVYPIPCHTLCRPGPRLIAGMEKLYNLFFGAGY
jgi:iron complex transport system substrate-binding protein